MNSFIYIIKDQKGLLSKLLLPIFFVIIGLTAIVAIKIVEHSVANHNMETVAQIEAIMNDNVPAAGDDDINIETITSDRKKLNNHF